MGLDGREEHDCDSDEEKHQEMGVSLNYLRLYKELQVHGGVLRAGGKVVAFSIGEKVGDTMIVHIEKAYAEVEGAYTMINQQFVLHEAGDCTYVNREEDTGDEGLRQAKESYHPVFMVQKGTVTEINEE